ncbi:MAG: GntR family transcriptional regulator [Treponema sp.]|nr:GntR family transcriptional regulator [Treponema sp.]MBQ9538445.1 GntR family transcriptional regulator [Treponema sp.]
MTIPEKLDRETNHDYALRVLQENIVSLDLKPGSMLSEQELATQLNISRTPVHEALQELANTKIIEVIPQRGSLVSLIDMALVEESCFIRSAIEGAVTEQACQKASAQDIESLEENVVLQEFYFGKQNLDKFMEFDNRFHQTMYKIAGRMLCYYTVQLMNIHHARFRTLRLHISNTERIITEHRAILDAIKQKDNRKARQEFSNHINGMFVDEKEIRRKYPDYFRN